MIRVVQDLTREELDKLKQSYICVMKRYLNIMTAWYLQKKIFLIIKISLRQTI